MTTKQIQSIQTKIGVVSDGFWGPKSIAACQKYLKRLMSNYNAPASDQSSLSAAYGAPGNESRLTAIDVTGLGVQYDGAPVKSIRCNAAVAESLLAIIQELSTFDEGRIAIAQYAGCYNNRKMRGGSAPSLHARGAAIDLMPARNMLNTHWPTKANMPFSVIEVFAKHGWLSAAAFWSRDAMHFQRTK
jgi:hypothetical protein